MGSVGKSVSFTADDIPPLDGKVILVTGGNIGLGKQCVLEYAKHKPAQIWLAARNLEKAKGAIEEIQKEVPDAPIKLLELDLADLESVKKAARTVLAEAERLDILMLNAGIMGTSPALTKDGYELQFGTNYVGHALLAQLLLPLLEKTARIPGADVRLIMVSSTGHNLAPGEGINFDSLKTEAAALRSFGRYGQSKLANILWARHMAKLHPQFTVNSLHPGLVRTNLMEGATALPSIIRAISRVMGRAYTPLDQGARNQLWVSVSKDVKSGEYYSPVGVAGKASSNGKSDNLAKKLWDWTQKELEPHLF
jgi:NAD(P)-dependent dehydrogenase (short-subunit alcohol dehydrogenase family)